ncbi:MAG: amidohydrolase family protein [Desulfatiglans sp.]|jgi:predicted TIM-barrel fold metal-dependent hydrolase|nr:amidohydrolase family protein [Desulfatiglans sp.]
MEIIDAWAQHPTKRFLEEPYFDSLKRWTGQEFEAVPLESTVDAMTSAGVGKALVPAWYGPKGPLISNEEVLEITKLHPELFVGIASADLTDPVAAVRALRHYVTEHGFKGLRIVQWVWELAPTHPLYYPLYVECVELNVPVCLQVGHTGPLRTSETGRPLHIERIALDFPDLKIVCGHIGYPWHVEMIAVATKFPNVYIDTSAYLPKRYPPELVDYMKAHGKRKVMFGSNYPMITPKACLKELSLLDLEEEIRDLFLCKNARGVFGI